MNRIALRSLIALCAISLATMGQSIALDDVAQLEQQAFQQAAERVAPSVVRIETVGGLDRVGKELANTAATTGLVVSADGHIITSSFNFAQQPSSVLVTLSGGERLAARIVSHDHNRMLTLLKISPPEPLPVPQAAPRAEVQVGRWAIAVGRTFDATRPNISVGIVSGVNRIWGKAVQTDAKISPANYGGPLVDIEGRVLGVLVPLSPDATGEMAGVEWYDSGIGFAIPLEHIESVLPKLQEGDLRTGVLGVNLKQGSMFGEPAVVLGVRPNSPASKSGFKVGDRIVEIDERPIERQAQLRSALNPRYAGERVQFVVARGEERVELEAELVAELQPYRHPFLGILPQRGGADQQGISVRYVYPDSPAAKAGIVAGDVVTSLAGQPVTSVEQAWEKLSAFMPGASIEVAFRHGDQSQQREVTLAPLPESIPDELPPASTAPAAEQQPAAEVGRVQVKLAEFPNDCLAYVPEDYQPGTPHGVLLWLHGAGGYTADALVERWKPICEQFDLILVAPHSADPAAWQPTELDFIKGALSHVIDKYDVDRTRVVAAGDSAGAVLAYVFSMSARDQVRGVLAINGTASRIGDNEPLQRLAFYVADSSKSRFLEQSRATVEKLKSMQYPVVVHDLGEADGPSADDLQKIGRWIDTLDRI